MIEVRGKLVSSELFTTDFVCHLEKCRGMCCVYGDAGAPLTSDESLELERIFPMIRPYMRQEGVDAIDAKGYWHFDDDGDRVTPLMGQDDCAYSIIDNGIARCAIETAYFAEAVSFRKPISCHLYPVRISQVGNYEALNYHRWEVCNPARKLGEEYGMPFFRFLKEALIRIYDEEFYNELEEVYKELSQTEK